MADLATLQLKIESGEADVAARRLGALADSAERLRKYINNMEQRWRQVTRGMNTALTELEKTDAFNKLTNGFSGIAVAAAQVKGQIAGIKLDFESLKSPVENATAALGKFQSNLDLKNSNKSINNLAANLDKAATAAERLKAANATGASGDIDTKLKKISGQTLEVQTVKAQRLEIAQTTPKQLGLQRGGINSGRDLQELGGKEPPTGFFGKLRQEVLNTNGILGAFKNQIKAVDSSITALRITGSLLAAGFIATRVANSALVRNLAEYETRLVTLRNVGVDTSASLKTQTAQFKLLDETARSTGRNTNFSAIEAAAGLETLAKAGLNATENVGAMPAVLNLAQAQLIEVDTAAGIVTSAMRQYGIAAIDASRITDVLSEVANRTATDVSALGESLKFVGPIAAQLGKSFEETNAALGVLANAGIQGALAGTTLRGVFTALTGPTDIARKAVASMGLEMENLDPAANSLTEIIERLADANITTTEAVDIFNKRNAATALILTENVKAFKILQEQTEENRLQTAKLAREQEQTLGGSIKKLRNSYIELTLSQQGLAKSLKEIIALLAGTFTVFAGNEEAIDRLDSSVIRFTYGLKVAAIAVGVFIATLAIAKIFAFTAAVSEASKTMSLFGATLTTISKINPFITIISIVGTVVGALTLIGDAAAETKDKFNGIKNSSFNQFVQTLTEDLFKLNAGIKEAAEQEDLQEQLSLTASKLALLKSFKAQIDIELEVKEGKIAATREDIQKLVEQAVGDNVGVEAKLNIVSNIEADVIKAETDRLVNDLLGLFSKVDIATVQSATTSASSIKGIFSDLTSEIRLYKPGPFTVDLKKLNDEIRALSPEKLDLLSEKIADFLDKGDTFKEFNGDFKLFLENLSSNSLNLTDLLRLPDNSIKNSVLKAIDEAITGTANKKEELENSLTPILKVDTADFIEAFGELEKEGDRAKKTFDELRESLEFNLGNNFSNLPAIDARAEENKVKAILEANKAYEAQKQAIEFKLEAEKEDLNVLLTTKTSYEDIVDKVRGKQRAIENLQKALVDLTGTRNSELAGIYETIEQLRVLEETRAREKELADARADAEDFFRSELVSLREGNAELRLRKDITEEGNESRKQEIRLYGELEQLIQKAVGAKQVEGLTIEEVITEIAKEMLAREELTASMEQEQRAAQNLARAKKQQFDAIRRLSQDLNAEISSAAGDRIDKEVADRIKRLTSGFNTEGLTAAMQKDFNDSLEDVSKQLEGPVRDIVTALDQTEKARQLGADVAKAFGQPLVDLLSGGTLKDAANNLLKNLFNIFVNVKILKPLEKAFEDFFGKSEGAKAFVSTEAVISDESVKAAEAKIAEIQNSLELALKIDDADVENTVDNSVKSLDTVVEQLKSAWRALGKDGGEQLKVAFDEASLAASRWERIAQELRDAFNVAARTAEAEEFKRSGLETKPLPKEIPALDIPTFSPAPLQFREGFPTNAKITAIRDLASGKAPRKTIDQFVAGVSNEPVGTFGNAKFATSDPFSFPRIPNAGARPRPIIPQAVSIPSTGRQVVDVRPSANLSLPARDSSFIPPSLEALRKDPYAAFKPKAEATRAPSTTVEPSDFFRELYGVEEQQLNTLEKVQKTVDTEQSNSTKTVEKQLTTVNKNTSETTKAIESTLGTKEVSATKTEDKQINTIEKVERTIEAESTQSTKVVEKQLSSIENNTDTTAKSLETLERVEKKTAIESKTPSVQLQETIKDVEFQPVKEPGSVKPIKLAPIDISQRSINSLDKATAAGDPGFDKEFVSAFEDKTLANEQTPLSGPPIEFGDVLGAEGQALVSASTALNTAANQLLNAAQTLLQAVGRLGTGGTVGASPSSITPPVPGSGLDFDTTQFAGPPVDPNASTFGADFTKALGSGVFNQGFGILNSLLSNKLGFALPGFKFAKGGAFTQSRIVERFEKGGAFSSKVEKHFATGNTFNNRSIEKVSDYRNKVVEKPTLAKLAEFGEKGPEAIVPLKNTPKGLGVSALIGGKEVTTLKLARGADGKLGVDFSSLSSDKTVASALGRTFPDNSPTTEAFAKGGVFTSSGSTAQFASGSIFERPENMSVMAPGSTTEPKVNVNVEAGDTSKPVNITINPTYNFGNNVKPDAAFRRSARQHEDDLKDRTRRALS